MNKQRKLLLSAALCTAFSAPSIAGWEVTWIDKFDGDGVNWDNWTAQTEANYNAELQCYTDDDSSSNRNYEVSDGTLKIIARKNETSTYCETVGENKDWTSGRLNSKDKQEFLYGRIEAKIKFDDLEGGTWPAFWMLENRINQQPVTGDDDLAAWPSSGAGEIDVWEWFSNSGDTYITNFFNTAKSADSTDTSCGSEVRYTYPNGAADVQDWHVYAMEWTADQIDFYIDDNKVVTQDMTGCSMYEEPMFFLLNVAMGGALGGDIESSLETATMEVDYVAHCQESDSSTATGCNEDTIVSDDTSTETPVVVEDAYIAYSDKDDAFSMEYWGDTWGSGTTIADSSDSPYNKSFALSPGTEWGDSFAVMAWGNEPENAIDITDYTVVRFKVKLGSHSSVDVSVNDGTVETKLTYELANAVDLGNGWAEVSASLPHYTNMTWVGLVFSGTDTAEIADVYFTTSAAQGDVTGDSGVDDSTDGANSDNGSAGEDAYIAFSGEDDTFSMKYWGDTWGSGTTIVDSSDSPYVKSYQLTPGTTWGISSAAMAWGNDDADAIDITGYSAAKFKVKTGTYDSVKVSVLNGNEDDKSEVSYDLSSGTDLGNGWVEISATLPDFTGMTWFALIFEGTDSVEIADVYFEAAASSDTDSVEADSTSSEPVPGAGIGHMFILMLGFLAVWRRR